MKQKQKTKQVITFNSLHIEVLGPRPLSKSRATDGCVTDFLRTVEHDTRHLLRECATISPELKGFRLRFDGR
jgi:hypothetical protein